MDMWTFVARATVLAIAASRSPGAKVSPSPTLERIGTNSNLTPAGTLRNGVLSLRLEVRTGTWYPEADDGATLTVQAFAEEGRAPTVPGPLVRVPEGTVIQIALKNTLDSAIIVYGLHRHPGSLRDSIIVPAGGTRELRFNAGSPGTYYYLSLIHI